MDFNKVTNAYIAIRDKRSAIRKAYEAEDSELKESLRKLEVVMLRHLLDTGTDSAKTATATFFKTETLKPSASDWDALYEWIKDHDAFEALERRIKTTFVKEFMDTHDGALPPGVSVHRELEVRVRRSD